MCGIAGITMYPKNRNENELAFIRAFAAQLAVENQERGTHATGIAAFSENGFDVLKHNIPAEEMITLEAWGRFAEKNITSETLNILIHTRMATKGSPTKNDNNHPIVTATNIGVHNGMIYNDDELFESEGLHRQAEVDSEVIFRLIDNSPNTKEGMQAVAEKLSGVFAVASVNKEERHLLNYFRDNNPTTFVYIPELNITAFASRKEYLTGALEMANVEMYHLFGYAIETDKKNLSFFSPKENIVMQFNAKEDFAMSQLNQEPLKFTVNTAGFYSSAYRGSFWDDMDFGYETKTEKTSKYSGLYDFIQEVVAPNMSESEHDTFMDLLMTNETNEWSRGYKAGRESLDRDLEVIKERERGQGSNRIAN